MLPWRCSSRRAFTSRAMEISLTLQGYETGTEYHSLLRLNSSISTFANRKSRESALSRPWKGSVDFRMFKSPELLRAVVGGGGEGGRLWVLLPLFSFHLQRGISCAMINSFQRLAVAQNILCQRSERRQRWIQIGRREERGWARHPWVGDSEELPKKNSNGDKFRLKACLLTGCFWPWCHILASGAMTQISKPSPRCSQMPPHLGATTAGRVRHKTLINN